MQEIIPQKNLRAEKRPIEMGFDFDDFDFRPVTKGLGFHHQEKLSENKNNRSIRNSLVTSSSKVAPPLGSTYAANKKQLNRSTPKLVKEAVSSQVNQRSARAGVQFTGFIFDLAIIFTLQMSLNFLFLKIVKLSSLMQFLAFTWLEQSLFFAFIYLFYFSLMDIVTSPGKKIFSLRLISTDKKKIGVDQTVIRSVVTLLSFVLLGMPALFDFHGKLSDTKLVEDV